MPDFKSMKANLSRLKYNQGLILPIFLFIWVILLITQKFSTNPGFGLDPSWKWALSKANAQSLIFGEEINFTWGTFSFLETGLCLTGIQIFWFVFYAIYKAVVIACFTGYILKSGTKISKFINLIFIFFFIEAYALSELGYIISAIILYYFLLITKNKLITFFTLNILTILSFFVKLTIFVNLIPVWVLALCFMVKKKIMFTRDNLKYIFGTVFVALLIYFNVNYSWYNYLMGSLEVINGYSFSMSYEVFSAHTTLLFFLLLVFLNICFVIFYFAYISNKSFNINSTFIFFNYLTLLSVTYIIFKHAYTRFDSGHAIYFIAFTFFILTLITSHVTIKTQNAYIVGFLIITLMYLSGLVNGKRKLPILAKNWSFKNFISTSTNYHSSLKKPKFTDTLLIANDLRLAYTNSNFLLPPTPQNYCTYTAKLDSLNFEYFKSKSIKTVFVQRDILDRGIDNQHPYLYNRWFFGNIGNFHLVDTISIDNIKYDVFNFNRNFENFANHTVSSNRIKLNRGDSSSIDNSDFLNKKRQLVIKDVHMSPKDQLFAYLKRPEDLHFEISSSVKNNPNDVVSFDIPSNYLDKPLSLNAVLSSFSKDSSLIVKINGRFQSVEFDIIY